MTRLMNPPGETPDVGIPPTLAARMTISEQNDWLRGFLRARPVSRRSALRQAAGALAGLGMVGGLGQVLAACGSPSGGTAPGGGAAPLAVTGRHLSFGADPTRQMAIAAELTARPTGTVLIDLGLDTNYGTTIQAEVRELVSHVPQQDGSIRSADQFFVHGLAEGLRPGERYHYRVRLPGGGTTPDAVFSTAPARAPFSFTAFGDQGVNGPTTVSPAFTDDYYKPADTRRTPTPASTLVGLVAARGPAFHLLAGDICYADPSGDGEPIKNNAPKDAEKGFDNFDPTTWTAYFHSIEASAATTPWMFATGNHDMEAIYDDNKAPGGATHGYGGHAARLDLPSTGPSNCPSVYWFKYSNVGVLSLDANDLSTEIATNSGYSGGAQVSWVRQTLAALRADPNIDFIVAFFHHCAYATSASHASDGGVRTALAPLFDEFSVDLVVQGHNHQYERTNPIKAGRTAVAAPDGATVRPETDGTTYICVGSGGRPRYSWQPGETDRYRGNAGPDSGTQVTSFVNVAGGGKQPEQVDWSQARYLDYALLAVDVVPGQPGSDSTMTVRAISDTGQEIDSVTLVRRARGTQPKPAALGSWNTWRRTPTGLSIPA